MFSQPTIYSKAAAARILGIDVELIKEVKGAFNCILVVFYHQRARFVTPRAFECDAVEFRIDGALRLSGDVWQDGQCPSTFWVTGSKGDLYQVNAHLGTCHCADFVFRGVKCKHQHLVSAHLASKQIRTDRPHFTHADEVALIANADYYNAVAESIGW